MRQRAPADQGCTAPAGDPEPTGHDDAPTCIPLWDDRPCHGSIPTMRITWVLPASRAGGIGGYAIVYGYANRLSRQGHAVTVIHLDPFPRFSSMHGAIRWPKRLFEWVPRFFRPGRAYEPDPAVRRLSTPRLFRFLVSNEDAVIATEWKTARPVARVAPAPLGFYFIQHHEIWNGPEDNVNRSWHLPLTRIVIAEWLVDVARDLGALPVFHLPNAIDSARFNVSVPVEQRSSNRVAMLWHTDSWKRSRDGFAALLTAHDALPGLTASMISRFPRPQDMPDWVEWHHDVTGSEVAEILNSAAILASPSEAEGWALPPAEALACGCALVSTDIGGVRDYAHQGKTALLVPVGDVQRLSEAIIRLSRDRELRLTLSRAGTSLIREAFTWEVATAKLARILQHHSDEAIVD